ncbi:unnamed protein product [Schistosoma margrebowiei]|uniref:Uncharacterized protein n=1 Tax=Schistosoma margrebowiei TaxID=48269 RepID=A0A183M001_9TREM|nr:unnamed protein product [Schistosoma margrebowiei]
MNYPCVDQINEPHSLEFEFVKKMDFWINFLFVQVDFVVDGDVAEDLGDFVVVIDHYYSIMSFYWLFHLLHNFYPIMLENIY